MPWGNYLNKNVNIFRDLWFIGHRKLVEVKWETLLGQAEKFPAAFALTLLMRGKCGNLITTRVKLASRAAISAVSLVVFLDRAVSRLLPRARTYNRNIELPAARLTEWVIDIVDSHRAEKESTRSSGHMSELSRISREVLRSWFPFNYWVTLSALFVLQTFLFFCFGKLSLELLL